MSRRELWNVWAIDPGGFTGVVGVIVPVVDGRLDGSCVDLLDRARARQLTFRHEITDDRWQEHVTLLVRGIRQARAHVEGLAARVGYAGSAQVVICEGFSGTDAVLQGDPFVPVKILGALDWALRDAVTEFRTPLPAAKGQITDQRLKLWTWHTPGKPHMNDAVRHLFVYLRSLE